MAKYISEEGKEYIPYDYDFANDIVPAINNLLPDVEKASLPRELKNIKVFLQGSFIGICFKDFDFGDVQSAGALFGATSSPYISTLYFINCRFGVNDGIDIPPAGVGFYDCVFEESYNVRIRNDKPDAPIEFNNCVFNGSLNFDNIHARIPVEIDRCLFNENSCLNMENFNDTAEFGLYHLEIRNTIFKGTVNFDGGIIPTKSILEYLTFFREISFKDTKIEKDVKIQNLSFAPFITKLAKDGFKSFLNALNVNGYGKEAKFYEQNVGAEAVEQKIDKDKLEIAIKSNWVSIKQAAAILAFPTQRCSPCAKKTKPAASKEFPTAAKAKAAVTMFPSLKPTKAATWPWLIGLRRR